VTLRGLSALLEPSLQGARSPCPWVSAAGSGAAAAASALNSSSGSRAQQEPPWDWFIELAATDMPLLPLDDIAAALSEVPRDHSFMKLLPLQSGNSKFQIDWRMKTVAIDYSLSMQNGPTHGIEDTGFRRPIPDLYTVHYGEVRPEKESWSCPPLFRSPTPNILPAPFFALCWI
jgi:hypothetical protein